LLKVTEASTPYLIVTMEHSILQALIRFDLKICYCLYKQQNVFKSNQMYMYPLD
jgi:hypothetical protein